MELRIPFGDLPEYPGPLCLGMQGEEVKLFQELMTLTGFPLVVDGNFGAATKNALHALSGREMLDEEIWSILVKRLEHALREIPAEETVQATALAYAKRHLRAGARELDEHRGPWVRIYTRGHEGVEHNWCCGFVSFCIAQARNTFTPLPATNVYAAIPYSLSCDELGSWAREHNTLITEHDGEISPGSLFLEGNADFNPADPHYTHSGFVDEFYGDSFTSIEGHFSDKVFAKYRAFGRNPIHFIDPSQVTLRA